MLGRVSKKSGMGKLVHKAKRWLGRGAAEQRERELFERFPLPDELEARLEQIRSESQTRKGGGSSKRKQRVLASLIVSRNYQRSVEIGVFAGSSLYPQAVAMQKTGGLALGIDPWSAGEAEQKDNLERIVPELGENWAATFDWDGLYREVAQRLEGYGLAKHCRLLRMPSNRASDQVEGPLDLVHIDGNHDYVRCADDLARWLPKLRAGGVLVLDDTSWDTIHPQYLELQQRMRLLYEEPIDGSPRPEWAVLEKT
jgi:predicted O-methyltransferase YrrM